MFAEAALSSYPASIGDAASSMLQAVTRAAATGSPYDQSNSPQVPEGHVEKFAQAVNFYTACRSENRYRPLDTFVSTGKV
jgi:hypothetical protein